ncbi:MAG: DUF177 domain-containing protein [Verrucomicrobia bacterium]|nr:DUF177 domain-containing protein [Verrucomicrobiota bacterium]
MSLICHLHQLEEGPVALEAKISAAELELEDFDELVRLAAPVDCRVEVQLLDDGILAKGTVTIPLVCECSRCLKAFDCDVVLRDWACLLPLEGEERVQIHGDAVDLTPYVREDTVLALPQHPLCRPDCQGLLFTGLEKVKQVGSAPRMESNSSVWAELNKLNLEK